MTTARSSVLIITHTARLGGAELALVRLCSAIEPSAVAVRVICFETGELVDSLRAAGVPVEVLKPLGRWASERRSATGGPVGAAKVAFGGGVQGVRVAARIRRLRPDVVQSWTLKSHLVTTVGLPLYRRPLVWFLHDRITDDYLGRFNRRVIEMMSRIPRAVIANSLATASTLKRHCAVAYPGLVPDQFLEEDRILSRTPARPPEVLLLGRISPTKGQREAIEAFSVVRREVPTARLRIVGEALFGAEEYETQCRLLVEDLALEEAVEFAGPTPDPRRDLDRASVLLHASPAPEPFGQVIAEAMARGVPVVATNAGGVPELLGMGSEARGLLVAPGDRHAMASAIVQILSDPSEVGSRVERAYLAATHRFTIARTVEVVTRTWRAVSRP